MRTIIARALILLPVILLVLALVANMVEAWQEIHEVDKPVLVEREEPLKTEIAAPASEQVRNDTAGDREEQPHAVSLGEFTITAYCACPICCGKDYDDPEYGITATGTVATEGRTIAVDPEVIPYGSIIYIGSHRYVAEDCGGVIRGNVIDIYMDSHDAALEFGRQTKEVWIFG